MIQHAFRRCNSLLETNSLILTVLVTLWLNVSICVSLFTSLRVLALIRILVYWGAIIFVLLPGHDWRLLQNLF